MKNIIVVITLFLNVYLYSQNAVDKIVAIVDNEIILKTELDFQINLVANQKKLNPEDPNLKNQVLNAMIEEKLLYAQAGLDSIIISEEEVARQIDYQINMFIQQYGSKERVEQVYGMTLEKIKRELRDDVRKNMMVQRLQEKKFGMIESSRREVEEFFAQYKDSLGIIPEKVKLFHIFMNPQTNERLKKKYYEFAKSILDSIKAGGDFSYFAKLYSEDPGSASQGGDLGFVKKGIFYPEFESAAFSLQTNEISGVVESPVGFHIIQLLEKRGEAIHTRHILIKVKADNEADLKTIEFLTDLRDSVVRNLGKFSDYAKKYSDDKETAPFGGTLGSFYLSQLDKNLLDAVVKLKEGEISFPKRVNYSGDAYGYHIVFLEKRIPQHKPNLEIDYDELKKFSDEYKRQKLYSKWIEELKSKIFWEIKL
jgi:peptidyl-prolyl cis-trans isomerase SurA